MEVSSPDGSRWETVDALVDTGASYSQVPSSLLQRLGIVPTDTVEAVLADGRVVADLAWTLRILSGISEGICNTMVQSGGEFLYIGVGGR